MKDSGGTDRGGIDSTAPQTISIVILPVNNRPSFSLPNTEVSMFEYSENANAAAYTVANFAQSISKGSPTGNENSQQITFTVTCTSSPASLFLAGAEPSISTDGTLSFEPKEHYFGSSDCSVVLSDDGGGDDTSAAKTFKITVKAVNDQPAFTLAQPTVTVAEDAGAQTIANVVTGISPGNEQEAAQTWTFQLTDVSSDAGTPFFSTGPSISATGTLTFTTEQNKFGQRIFKVVLIDSENLKYPSAGQSDVILTIDVTGVNDPPQFTLSSPTVTVKEDAGPVTKLGFVTGITSGNPEEYAQTLTFTLTATQPSAAANLFATLPAISPDGKLTFTSANNAFGSSVFNVVLSDSGGLQGETKTLTITVEPVNDRPYFVIPTRTVTRNEDAGQQTVAGFATSITAGNAVEDTASEGKTFVLTDVSADQTVATSAFFSQQPAIDSSTGDLTFTTAANAFGTREFSVILRDEGTPNLEYPASDDTPILILLIINPMNEPPVFTLPASSAIVLIDEDASEKVMTNFVTGVSAGDKEDAVQAVTFILTDITLPANGNFFTSPPQIDRAGTLKFTVAPNAYGDREIKIVIRDSDGSEFPTAAEGDKTFMIKVKPINDAPVFTISEPTVRISEDAGTVSMPGFATGISVGNAAESGQSITFTLTDVSPDAADAFFDTAPSINAQGTLTFKVLDNMYGTRTIQAKLSDDGLTGSAADPKHTTATVTIVVDPVNDPPVFALSQSVVSVQESAGRVLPGFLTGVTPGGLKELTQKLTFFAVQKSGARGLLRSVYIRCRDAAQLCSDGRADVTIEVVMHRYGVAVYEITAQDDAGGSDTSVPATLTINVTAVNDPPSFHLVEGTLRVGIRARDCMTCVFLVRTCMYA